MNWLVRNIAVVVVGAATSLLTVAYLLYLEASQGQAIFSFNGQGLANFHFLAYLPVGAIFAGFAGAIGYLAVALALRVRPARIVLFSMLAISAAVVYLAQSAEMELWMGARNTTRSSATFGRFLLASAMHSPVHFWTTTDDASAAYATSVAFGDSSATSQAAATGDARADGIGNGVNGMLASQDASNSATVRQLNRMDANVESIGSGLSVHKSQWLLTVLQALGFAIGSLVVFLHLRSFPHCEDCKLLLSPQGTRTRYYLRTPEMRNSVDDVLNKARERQYRESIQSHLAKGSDEKTKWAEYFSTLEISRCRQCRALRLNYRTFRKDGSSWKDIAIMGFTANTLEPLDFV